MHPGRQFQEHMGCLGALGFSVLGFRVQSLGFQKLRFRMVSCTNYPANTLTTIIMLHKGGARFPPSAIGGPALLQTMKDVNQPISVLALSLKPEPDMCYSLNS